MRRVLLVGVFSALAACGARSASEPAWPKAAEADGDGGESLSPHEGAKAIAAAVEEEAKPAEKATPVAEKAADKAAPAVEKPAEKPADKTEDPLTTEEIIIEIED